MATQPTCALQASAKLSTLPDLAESALKDAENIVSKIHDLERGYEDFKSAPKEKPGGPRANREVVEQSSESRSAGTWGQPE